MEQIEVRRVTLDDLYHPQTLADYDPNCCCAFCLDVSYARSRRNQAATYRAMRREGNGKLARLYWRAEKRAIKVGTIALAQKLFSESTGPHIGGLQALLADI